MAPKLLFFIVVLITYECSGGIIKGILEGAHDVAGAVLGGISHGFNLNVQGHAGFHGQNGQHSYNKEGNNPGRPEQTIVVVVEDKPGHSGNHVSHDHHHHHHGRPEEKPHYHQPNFENNDSNENFNENYNQNGHWNGNQNGNLNGNKLYGNSNNNWNGNPDQNGNWNGNSDQNGNWNSNSNQNGNWNGQPNQNGNNWNGRPNQNGNTNTNSNHHPNNWNCNPNQNENHSNGRPNQNGNGNGNGNPNQGGNWNQQGNSNNAQPSPSTDTPNQGGPEVQEHTMKPARNPSHEADHKTTETNNGDYNNHMPLDGGHGTDVHHISKPDVSTKKPDDSPLYVPLKPNDYVYGGDKIEVNAPKRDTESAKDNDDEDLPIDVRIDI